MRIINWLCVYPIITDIRLWFSVGLCITNAQHWDSLEQHCQTILEQGVCDLAHSFFYMALGKISCFMFNMVKSLAIKSYHSQKYSYKKQISMLYLQEAYEYDHIENILLGIAMFTVQQLVELSNQVTFWIIALICKFLGNYAPLWVLFGK